MKWFRNLPVFGQVIYGSMGSLTLITLCMIGYQFTPTARAQAAQRAADDHSARLERSAMYVSEDVLYVNCREVRCSEALTHFREHYADSRWQFSGTVSGEYGTIGFYFIRWPE